MVLYKPIIRNITSRADTVIYVEYVFKLLKKIVDIQVSELNNNNYSTLTDNPLQVILIVREHKELK